MICELRKINLSSINTLVFAGGGNRCWWQGGILASLQNKGWPLPSELIGTSAGAAVAASCITYGPEFALQVCKHLYSTNLKLFNLSALFRMKIRFAHYDTYPSWISSFVNESSFDVIRQSKTKLKVALTRVSPYLGVLGSTLVGTSAYMINKYIWNDIHPLLPKKLGLRQEFFELSQCSSSKQAQLLLRSAAAAPPFMPAVKIGSTYAIDGGYTDNAPIPEQSFEQRSSTLVLLTRHYPKLPAFFSLHDRLYWQPSERIPVSTWDCTSKATVDKAFLLGHKDASNALKSYIIW